jgi:hypothetical protein
MIRIRWIHNLLASWIRIRIHKFLITDPGLDPVPDLYPDPYYLSRFKDGEEVVVEVFYFILEQAKTFGYWYSIKNDGKKNMYHHPFAKSSVSFLQIYF